MSESVCVFLAEGKIAIWQIKVNKPSSGLQELSGAFSNRGCIGRGD